MPFIKFDAYTVLSELRAQAPKVSKVHKVGNVLPALGQTLETLETCGAVRALSQPASVTSLRSSAGQIERASIDLSGVPDAWKPGLQRLAMMDGPTTIDRKIWDQIVTAVDRFAGRWAEQAAALEWSSLELFGCHPTHPQNRYDRMGLIWMLRNASLRALTAELASLQNESGATLAFRKPENADGRVHIWDL